MDRKQMGSDIGYVRQLVSRSENQSFSRAIYMLWAAIVLVGFSLVDLAPEYVGWFWMIMGPAGGIASGFLGKQACVEIGQMDKEDGIKHALHWGGMFVFILLVILLAAKGLIEGKLISQIILLIVSFGWWTAGVHFDKNFRWLAGIMAAGFVASLFISNYVWIGMGVLMSMALTGIALSIGKNNAD